MGPPLKLSSKKVPFTNWFYASLLPNVGGRIRLESLAGMKWNRWPDSRGITGRFGVEYASQDQVFVFLAELAFVFYNRMAIG